MWIPTPVFFKIKAPFKGFLHSLNQYIAHLLLCVVIALPLFSYTSSLEQPRFERYTRENALFNGTVRYIQQDKTGHLWLAGNDGISRFDGIKTTQYTIGTEGNTGIQAITSDTKGNLLLASQDGKLFFYQYSSDAFKLDPNLDKNTRFRVIPARGKNSYFISSDGDLYKYSSQGQHIKLINSTLLTSANKIYDADAISDTLLIATEQGALLVYRSERGAYRVSKVSDGKFYSTVVWKNNAFFGGAKGLIKHSLVDNSASEKINSIANIYSLLIGPSDKLWLGTYEQGIYTLDLDNANSKNRIYYDRHDALSLPKDNIFALYQDDFSNIWISTDNGIAKYNIPANFWNHIRQTSTNGLVGESINQISEDSSLSLWVGTQNSGISIFDANNNVRQLIIKKRRNDSTDVNNINSAIYSFYQHSDGHMWVGHSEGIKMVDPSTLQHQDVFFNSDVSHIFSPVFTINEAYNTTWIGTYKEGIYRIRSNNILGRYTKDKTQHHGLNSDTIYEIFKDISGEIWVLTAKGMYLYNPEFDRFLNFSELVNSNKYSEYEYNTIRQTDKNTYWIGTAGKGILIYDRKQEKIIKTIRSPALKSDYINGIQISDNILYASTNNGLYAINTESHTIKEFGYDDGLQSNEFNNGASYRRKDNTLVFGGIYGFNHFSSYLVSKTNTHAKSYIELTNAESKVIYTGNGFEIASVPLQINHDDFPLTLKLKAIHHASPKKNKLRFKIGANAPSWSKAGPTFQLSIQSLPRNINEILVQAKSKNSEWSKNASFVKLNVIPAPWHSIYAYIAYALCVIAIFILVYQWRVGVLKAKADALEDLVSKRTYEIAQQKIKIERQFNQLEKLSNEKTKFFENLSHEFRTPLTLILGPMKSLMAQVDKNEHKSHLEIAKRNTLRLMHIIDQLLEVSRLNSGLKKIEPASFDLHLFVEELIFEFSSIAKETKTSLINSIPEKTYIRFDVESLQQILFNLTSNGIKYNKQQGKVIFSTSAFDNSTQDGISPKNMLLLHVEDTGIGIKTEQLQCIFDRFSRLESSKKIAGTGIGLSLVKELINLNQANITVESQAGVGTRFSISLEAVDVISVSHINMPHTAQLLEMQSVVSIFPQQAKAKAENINNEKVLGEQIQIDS